MWMVLKIVMYLFGALLVYGLYMFVARPLYLRYKYSKYKNVFMTEKFHFMEGDFANVTELMNQNKFMCYNYVTQSLDKVGDIWLSMFGSDAYFYCQSVQAIQELYDNLPNNIDRGKNMLFFLTKLSQDGMEIQPSTENWKLRRTTFNKLIGINHSSKYIPIIVQQMQDMKKLFKKDETVDFSIEAPKIFFNIISKILFGKDLSENAGLLSYKASDGTIEKMEIGSFFIRVWKDIGESAFHPLTAFVPVLNKKNLVNPFKRDYNNALEFRRALKEFLKTTKDTESVYSKLKEDQSLDEDQLFWDLITFLLGGTDTSAHLISSALYFIQKNEGCYEKLMNEINKFFPAAIEDLKVEDFMKNLEQWDYLNYLLKECLRLDPPSYESTDYVTVNDVTICGVPIPKDSWISVNFMGAHMDPEQWFEPLKFIPERFDPSHEYFKTPDGKNRHPLSYIPFSAGLRNCPGQSLARLEAKVVLIYLLKHIKYTVEKELLDNDYISFSIISQFKLKFKIDSVT